MRLGLGSGSGLGLGLGLGLELGLGLGLGLGLANPRPNPNPNPNPNLLEAATRCDGATAARVDNSTGGLGGARVVAAAIDGPTLRGWLGAELAGRLEAQWGELGGYRGLGTQQDG